MIGSFLQLLVGLVILRVAVGVGRWFFSEPESVRGWVLRGAIVWAMGRLMGHA